jgi:DNA-directed RNA polymerase subunit K/omega
MGKDIKARVQGQNPNIEPRNMQNFIERENINSIYEALAVISKRAGQLSLDLKIELKNKLEEFSIHQDTIEEIIENKEQIEITKFYEKLPNPALIATYEFFEEKLNYEYRDDDGNVKERSADGFSPIDE